MKNPFKPTLLPALTLGLSGIGLALRVWLFYNGTDEKGLLSQQHPANVLLFILAAVTVLLLFLCTRDQLTESRYSRIFPASLVASIGCFAGSAGILYVSIAELFHITTVLSVLLFLSGILASGSLMYVAVCRLRKRRPTFLAHCVVCIFMMFNAITQCRSWSSETQLQNYIFQLFATVFFMLTAYQYAALDIKKGDCRYLAFYNQAAVFFSFLSFIGSNRLFYMAMALWLATNLCAPLVKKPRKHLFLKED